MNKRKLFTLISLIALIGGTILYTTTTISTELPNEDEIIATMPKTTPVPVTLLLVIIGIILFIITRNTPCPWRRK